MCRKSLNSLKRGNMFFFSSSSSELYGRERAYIRVFHIVISVYIYIYIRVLISHYREITFFLDFSFDFIEALN